MYDSIEAELEEGFQTDKELQALIGQRTEFDYQGGHLVGTVLEGDGFLTEDGCYLRGHKEGCETPTRLDKAYKFIAQIEPGLMTYYFSPRHVTVRDNNVKVRESVSLDFFLAINLEPPRVKQKLQTLRRALQN